MRQATPTGNVCLTEVQIDATHREVCGHPVEAHTPEPGTDWCHCLVCHERFPDDYDGYIPCNHVLDDHAMALGG